MPIALTLQPSTTFPILDFQHLRYRCPILGGKAKNFRPLKKKILPKHTKKGLQQDE